MRKPTRQAPTLQEDDLPSATPSEGGVAAANKPALDKEYAKTQWDLHDGATSIRGLQAIQIAEAAILPGPSGGGGVKLAVLHLQGNDEMPDATDG